MAAWSQMEARNFLRPSPRWRAPSASPGTAVGSRTGGGTAVIPLVWRRDTGITGSSPTQHFTMLAPTLFSSDDEHCVGRNTDRKGHSNEILEIRHMLLEYGGKANLVLK